MAGAGKAFIKHTRPLTPPEQVHDNGFGLPPHPLVIREGMRFFPRKRDKRKSEWPLTVRARPDEDGQVRCRRDEPTGPVDKSVAASWLLQRRADGQGTHVQFVGWVGERKYATVAHVEEIVDGVAILVLPEWHPARPVPLDARLLPPGGHPGAWVRCRADLSVGRPARLALSHLAAVDPPSPDEVHPPAYVPPERRGARERPAVGEGCGDIVLNVEPDVLDTAPRSRGLIELFVYRRPDAAREGDRVYLAPLGSTHITTFVRLRQVKTLPVGALLRCDPTPVALATPERHPGGQRHATRWLWRWFPALEAS